MGDGADEFAVLDNRTAGHARVNIGQKIAKFNGKRNEFYVAIVTKNAPGVYPGASK